MALQAALALAENGYNSSQTDSTVLQDVLFIYL
jgi:hypothetical protein